MGDDLGGPGVVDQHVEPAVAGDDLVDQPPGLVLVGDVGLHVAGPGELGGQRLPASTDVDELMTTVAPEAANRRAVAAPIPDDEPVTRTVCSRNVVVTGVGEDGDRVGHGPSVGPDRPGDRFAARFRRVPGAGRFCPCVW